MKKTCIALALFGLLLAVVALPAVAAPPDYKPWGELLAKYYDPAATLSDEQIHELVRIGTSAPTSFRVT